MNINPKVRNGTLGSALSVLILWCLHEFAGVHVPTEVAGAIVVLVTFLVGYATSTGSWAPKNYS